MAEEHTKKKKSGKERSYKTKVILWTIVILVIDEVTIGIPEADLLLFYIVLAKPAWFLNMMHRLYQYVPHRRAWRPVKEVCQRQVATVPADATVADAARRMRDQHVTSLLVVEEREYLPPPEGGRRRGGRSWWKWGRKKQPPPPAPVAETIRVPVGVLSDRDIVLEVGSEGLSGEAVTVAEVMTTDLAVTLESEDVHAAVEKMREAGMRRLPVVDERGSLVGILNLDDTIAMLSEGLNDMAELLRRETERELRSDGR